MRLRLRVSLSELLEHLRPHRAGAPGERFVERERRRLEWIAWLEMIARLGSDRDYLVAACAYCRRVRTPGGAWREAPPTLQAYLEQRQRLSHTYCPECLDRRGLAGAT